MYQLATKYGLQSSVKNEALGLWYDAKTKISQLMGDLKEGLSQKKKQIESNFLSSKINSEREHYQ